MFLASSGKATDSHGCAIARRARYEATALGNFRGTAHVLDETRHQSDLPGYRADPNVFMASVRAGAHTA